MGIASAPELGRARWACTPFKEFGSDPKSNRRPLDRFKQRVI